MLQIPARRIFRPAFPMLTCSPDGGVPCAGDKRCFECRLLSETQFKCFVAYWKKGDVSKGKNDLSRLEAQRRRESCLVDSQVSGF